MYMGFTDYTFYEKKKKKKKKNVFVKIMTKENSTEPMRKNLFTYKQKQRK